jgi:hypothetical protein
LLQEERRLFLSLLRNNADLDFALPDVEDGICRIALRKDDLILAVISNASSVTHPGKNRFGSNDGIRSIAMTRCPLVIFKAAIALLYIKSCRGQSCAPSGSEYHLL